MPRQKKLTLFQERILTAIAQSPLTKTYSAERRTIWALKNGREISAACAEALIGNGWVIPSPDALLAEGESQTYTVRPQCPNPEK